MSQPEREILQEITDRESVFAATWLKTKAEWITDARSRQRAELAMSYWKESGGQGTNNTLT